MEKTMEQKLASKERYLAQEAKALDMLRTEILYDYIDGLKYSLSLCMRYNKNFGMFIIRYIDFYNESHFDKCLKCGILKPWKDTLWFDKEKAESLQQYILEHRN